LKNENTKNAGSQATTDIVIYFAIYSGIPALEKKENKKIQVALSPEEKRLFFSVSITYFSLPASCCPEGFS